MYELLGFLGAFLLIAAGVATTESCVYICTMKKVFRAFAGLLITCIGMSLILGIVATSGFAVITFTLLFGVMLACMIGSMWAAISSSQRKRINSTLILTVSAVLSFSAMLVLLLCVTSITNVPFGQNAEVLIGLILLVIASLSMLVFGLNANFKGA